MVNGFPNSWVGGWEYGVQATREMSRTEVSAFTNRWQSIYIQQMTGFAKGVYDYARNLESSLCNSR